jgi:hypothetical protein
MNLLENSASSANKLLMGPDGLAYVLPTGTLAAYQPSDGGAIASPRFRGISRDAVEEDGTSGGCFMYSADVAPDDGQDGTAGGCFMYSADVTPDDGESGVGSGCFMYSADVRY